jgi:hypothetical protein
MCWVRISIRARCTTLCDKVCQWLATCRWFSPSPPVSSTNTTDRHDIAEILLKVALNTIKLKPFAGDQFSGVIISVFTSSAVDHGFDLQRVWSNHNLVEIWLANKCYALYLQSPHRQFLLKSNLNEISESHGYAICICCFFANSLRNTSNDWLGWYHDNMFEWCEMSTRGLLS